MFSSSPVFFRRGLTIAFFRHSGTTPQFRDVFIICVIQDTVSVRHSLSIGVGIGSISQDLDGDFSINSRTADSETSSNDVKVEPSY